MFEKIQKGVYNLPLDISHSSSNLKAAHNLIKSGEVLIFRNAVNKDLVNSIKAHLIALGRSSYPNYHAISTTSPNFHRLNDEDERAFVKGRFQQFNYFPWNQDYFNFFKRFKFIFELKNALSNLPINFGLETSPDSEFTAKLSFQFYPAGGGYLVKHADPVDKHQLAICTLVMSNYGEHFNSGGTFMEMDGKKVFVERFCKEGDIIFNNAQIPHGVDKIDENHDMNWLEYKGRWMGLFANNKFSHVQSVSDSLAF